MKVQCVTPLLHTDRPGWLEQHVICWTGAKAFFTIPSALNACPLSLCGKYTAEKGLTISLKGKLILFSQWHLRQGRKNWQALIVGQQGHNDPSVRGRGLNHYTAQKHRRTAVPLWDLPGEFKIDSSTFYGVVCPIKTPHPPTKKISCLSHLLLLPLILLSIITQAEAQRMIVIAK